MDAECGEGDVEDTTDLVVTKYTRAGQGRWEGAELWRWNSEAETDSVAEVPLAFVVAEDGYGLHGFVVDSSSQDNKRHVLGFLDDETDPIWNVTFEANLLPPNAATFVDMAVQVVHDSAGVVVLGKIAGQDGYFVASYTQAGAVRWRKLVDQSIWTSQVPAAISCNSSGEVFVTGTLTPSVGGTKLLAYKLNATTGDSVWVRRFGTGTADYEALDIEAQPAAAGVVLMLGTRSSTQGDDDVVLVCYPEQTSVSEGYAYYGAPGIDEVPYALKIGGPGAYYGVFVELGTEDAEGDAVTRVVKYNLSGLNLTENWSRDLRSDVPAGMVVDGQGNCYAAVNLDEAVSAVRYTTDGHVGPVWSLTDEENPPEAAGVAAYYNTTEDSFCVMVGSQDSDDEEIQALVVICDVGGPGSWTLLNEEMPSEPSYKDAKAGAWLVADDSTNLVYAAKGNNWPDFYRYYPERDSWVQRQPWPVGHENKKPKYGSAACCDGNGIIYATKGNKTLGFWKYDAAKDSWYQQRDVPLGLSNRRVQGGTDLAYARNRVYLLKGYKNEFYRYNPTDSTWTTLYPAPVGAKQKWDKGSWLAYDGDSLIYAHKAKYHEFYAYNLNRDTWGPLLEGMPIAGSAGSKASKDGGCAVWVDGAVFALKGNGTQEFWMYSPLIEGWPLELDTIPTATHSVRPKKVKAGADMTVCNGRIYALKGNKTRDLLRYSLPGGGVDALLREHFAAQRLMKDQGRQTGGESPVTEGIEAFCPRWRSDGAAVILAHDDSLDWSQVYEVEYSGGVGTETRIVDVEAHCEEPSYNDAGDMVCFTIDTAGYTQIAVVDLDTSDNGRDDATGCTAPVQALSADGTTPKPRALGDITILSSSSYDHSSPSFSPSGDYICFVRESEDGDDDVWCVPADGGSEVQLTACGWSHADPVWLNETTLVFTHIPDDDCDQIGKLVTTTSTETDLTSSSYDHARPDATESGTTVCFERFDDDGTHIAKVSASGGSETVLTTGAQDMDAPDWCNDYAIFCTRWTGITSAICRVNAVSGGWTPVTDSSAIRDNPDCWYNQVGNTSYITYERENWDPPVLFGNDGRKKKWGTGIFKMHFREPQGGQQGASMYTFALEKAEPNPATNRVRIRWQVPVEAQVSLRVYNTAGQLVKVLADGRVKPGAHTSVWNGTDTRGRRLANGVYFCALDNGAKRISRKLVLTD